MNLATETAIPARYISRLRETDDFARTDEVGSPTERCFVVLENSTAPKEETEDIGPRIRLLFEAAREQLFEDGMESDFAAELAIQIRRYGNDVIAVLTRLIISEQVEEGVASEALRVLGCINHRQTYESRLWLLERSLYCTSPWIRDGAALGLAWLDDPRAVRYLRQAIEREQIKELQEDMDRVLIQLETH